MNRCVPDFGMADDASIPSSSGCVPPKKFAFRGEEDRLVELLWQNGQVVMQCQNQRSQKRSPPLRFSEEISTVPPGRPDSSHVDEIGSSATAATSQLFMQEDEMSSWLHYPLEDAFDRDFCADLLYTPAGRAEEKPPAAPLRPPIHPARRAEAEAVAEAESPKFMNFTHFSRGKGKGESQPLDSERAGRESTVVDSSETPAVGTPLAAPLRGQRVFSTCGGSGDGEVGTCDATMTSSSDRKRKARQADESECQSEDAEYESLDEKKVGRRSTSARRARAAEVHNLSERRRRDRINEKMKALQELIPRCNKSDKASMLDEAIEYLKSLQLQVQMMSMGCSMAPMMFPSMQQYISPMGMGMGMGMDMAAATGFSRPMLPFPPVMGGPTIPGPGPAHMGPRFPISPFHLHVPPSEQRVQATNLPDPASNSVGLQNPNLHQQNPNFTDPHHHYLGHHHMRVQPQNQAKAQQSTPTKGADPPENHKSG